MIPVPVPVGHIEDTHRRLQDKSPLPVERQKTPARSVPNPSSEKVASVILSEVNTSTTAPREDVLTAMGTLGPTDNTGDQTKIRFTSSSEITS